jgi:chromosome segregation ATPase
VSNAPFEIAGMRVAIASLEDAVEKLERENAEMRHSEENLAATVRGLEFELEKAQKTAAMLRGTVEALGDANDRLTIEITALRDAKRVAEEVCGEVFAKCFADYAAQTLLKQNQP